MAAAGLVFGATAMGLAFNLVFGFGSAVTEDIGTVLVVPFAAGLAGAVTGAPLWSYLVEVPGRPTRWRGAKVGVAVGFLAHPLTWLFFGLARGVGKLVADGPVALVVTVVGDAAELLVWFLLVSLAGVALVGIVSVPFCAGAGVVLADLCEKEPTEEGAVDERPPPL